MISQESVVVGIVKDLADFQIIQRESWYRIPVEQVNKWLKNCWPPRWVAFYMPKIFGDKAFTVRYYAEITEMTKAYRAELFPNELYNEKSKKQYYKLSLGPLQEIPDPIISHRRRRVTLICTNWNKFISAREINDLYDDSPLENRLWDTLKKHEISAERQEFIKVGNNNYYALDFAIYCVSGKIDIETDGDTWHKTPVTKERDQQRDKDILSQGWKVIRFDTDQIKEEMEQYCIPKISTEVNKLGGVHEEDSSPKKINIEKPSTFQPSLFED